MEKLPSELWKIDIIFGNCLTGCGKVRRESLDPDDPLTKTFDKLWDEAKTNADSASKAHPKIKKTRKSLSNKTSNSFPGRAPSMKPKAQTPAQKNTHLTQNYLSL